MIEIKLVKHQEQKGQLLDLFQASFGHDRPAELWDWRYIQNPLATPDTELVVALDNGKIVGARPFRLAQMWLGDEKVMAAQHCDTMVHPDHQRKGIFNQMGQFSMEYLKENGYALSYGFPNRNSRQGFLQQGYRIVVPRESIFRPINPQKLISYRLGNKVLGTGLGFFYDKVLNIKPRRPLKLASYFQLEVFDQFNEELKEIDTLRNKSLIELVRSESHLRWRFDRRPNRDYRYVVAKRDQTLSGYAVVSAQKQNSGLVHGYLVDYLIKDRDIACFQALVNRSLDELEEWGCDIAFIWAPGEPVLREELLKHLGFKSPFMFPYNRFPGHGYLDAIRIDEQAAAGVNIYDKENWRVTYAYSGDI